MHLVDYRQKKFLVITKCGTQKVLEGGFGKRCVLITTSDRGDRKQLDEYLSLGQRFRSHFRRSSINMGTRNIFLTTAWVRH